MTTWIATTRTQPPPRPTHRRRGWPTKIAPSNAIRAHWRPKNVDFSTLSLFNNSISGSASGNVSGSNTGSVGVNGVTDPNGDITNYAYNALNALSSVTDPAGDKTSYAYNKGGQLIGVTDPLGNDPTYSYDAQGRLLSKTDNNGGVTKYSYDLAGNLASLTDPDGNVTSYAYNAANELTATTNPLGNQTTYAYNAGGLLTSTTDADGRTIEYAYDADGRETSETWVGGNYTATYAYNADGELTSASDPYSVYTYSYNALGDVASVSNAGTPGVPTVTLSYAYDSLGNRVSLSDSLGGSINYVYNGDNQMTSLSLSTTSMTADAQLSMAYDNNGNLTELTRTDPAANGDTITTRYSYDAANRLTNILSQDATTATTLSNYTYGYDVDSRITSYQDSNSSLSYGYDKTGQLLSASGTLNGSSYSVSYSYDANGNRTLSGYQTGTGNELLSDGTYNYTYDKNGNTLTRTNIATGTVTYYTWDYRNRLTEMKVEDANGNVLNDETFTYDVFNRRIGVTLNGTQQLYTVYDGANPYIDFNGSGTLTERYLTNPQGLSQFYGQVDANGTTQWFLTDNLGSIRQVVDTSGNLLDSITYDPYGNILSQTNAANAPRFLYAGGDVDSISGTYLNGDRELNPADGRWLNQDPMGFVAGDMNLYRYVFNSPMNHRDPSGLIIVITPPKEIYPPITIIGGYGGENVPPPGGFHGRHPILPPELIGPKGEIVIPPGKINPNLFPPGVITDKTLLDLIPGAKGCSTGPEKGGDYQSPIQIKMKGIPGFEGEGWWYFGILNEKWYWFPPLPKGIIQS